jgi:hypothetical protein
VEEVDLPDMVIDQIGRLTARIEADLRSENERIREIRGRIDGDRKGGNAPWPKS